MNLKHELYAASATLASLTVFSCTPESALHSFMNTDSNILC